PYGDRDLGLGRMRELLRRLGDPQRRPAIIHVAGTKGKGSTAAMLSAALTAAGHRVGRFTSPHLERLEERLAIDGVPCSADELVDLVERLRPVVAAMDREAAAARPAGRHGVAHGPTYFELTTAMALLHFAARDCGLAVLEVGLGGRLDSTNVCTPLVSVITSISFDHTAQLGGTLAAIAAEKAGIIKPGVPVISGVRQPEPRGVIRRACRDAGAPLRELGVDFDCRYDPPNHLERAASPARFEYQPRPAPPGRSVRQPITDHRSPTTNHQSPSIHHPPPYHLPLPGRHQAANAALALAVIDQLRSRGWDVPERAVRDGLRSLRWPARAEVVARRQAVVLDVAHNPASIHALIELLGESFSAARRHLVFAATLEKDVRGMLDPLLAHFDTVALTRYLSNPRAVPPEELAALAERLGSPRPPTYGDPVQAWRSVRRRAGPDDLICVTGSFFLAAELRERIDI
ncbi:MAG: bifunctional folylpolyglutamate synthase/dihydrofolate synthase, partial [Pirellulales bacterium]